MSFEAAQSVGGLRVVKWSKNFSVDWVYRAGRWHGFKVCLFVFCVGIFCCGLPALALAGLRCSEVAVTIGGLP